MNDSSKKNLRLEKHMIKFGDLVVFPEEENPE